MLIDYHLHTNATVDGTASLMEMVEAVSKRGIREIAVTDHFVPGVDSFCIPARRLEQHARDVETAKKHFDVTVRVGAEVDYFPGAVKQVEKFIRSHDFDIILGTSHFLDGYSLADEESAKAYFRGRTAKECYRAFFAAQCETVRSGLFDVMAHPDIIRKFGDVFLGPVPFEEYAEDAAALADAMKETGAGFEVNCRGFDHAPADTYPSLPFLKLLAGKSVGPVTVGSDAHDVGKAGLYVDRGFERLREAGYRSVSLFSRRKATEIPI